MTDKRIMYKGKKSCLVCETPIPDSDKEGVSTGACSPECYESPGYHEDDEDDG